MFWDICSRYVKLFVSQMSYWFSDFQYDSVTGPSEDIQLFPLLVTKNPNLTFVEKNGEACHVDSAYIEFNCRLADMRG